MARLSAELGYLDSLKPLKETGGRIFQSLYHCIASLYQQSFAAYYEKKLGTAKDFPNSFLVLKDFEKSTVFLLYKELIFIE